jgi:hypothetical protein
VAVDQPPPHLRRTAGGAPNLATYAVGDNLSGAIVMLLTVPVFAVAFGALGAWLATHTERAPR